MTLRRLLLVTAVAGAVLASATTAFAGHRSRSFPLSQVPLEQAQLGSAGASLALAYGSGYEDNSISIVIGGPGGSGQSLGALRGYVLDYGDPFTGSTGVMEIRSSVEDYGSPTFAEKIMRFRRLLDTEGTFFSPPGVTTKVKPIKAEKVGERRFGYLITASAPNLNPIVKLDEQVAMGKYIVDLTVAAGSASAAEHIAPHLVRLLHNRLRRLIWGHSVEAKKVKLPPQPKPGPAQGGPDLSATILQPPDIGQPHAVNLIQAYTTGPPALSDYFMFLAPAGKFQGLQQQIAWWPTATEATYGEAYQSGGFGGFLFPLFSGSGTATAVDLSAVGDSAVGYRISESGGTAVYITLTNGQAGESVYAISNSALSDQDVQELAQAAANRLNAGI